MKSHGFCGIVADFDLQIAPDDVDWDELHTLLNEAFAYMDGRIDPPSSLLSMTVETLREKAQNETLVQVLHDGRIVGCMFCRFDKPWLYVGKVAVSLDNRGKGLGRMMFKTAFDIAARMQAKGLELETRIELIENHRAFEKLGFVKVSESAHEGYDRPTSICMRAEL